MPLKVGHELSLESFTSLDDPFIHIRISKNENKKFYESGIINKVTKR